LIAGQKRSIAQLERIWAAIEWRWGLEDENRKKENRDDEGDSKDGPGESQEEETLSSASY